MLLLNIYLRYETNLCVTEFKGMFTLDVCVCVCVNITVKVYHCVNGNANTNAQNGSEPILDILH